MRRSHCGTWPQAGMLPVSADTLDQSNQWHIARMVRSSLAQTEAITLWDAATRTQITTLKLNEHNRLVTALAFSPDGTILAWARVGEPSLEATGEINLLNIATNKNTTILSADGGYVFRLAFSPDGKTLASGGGKPEASGEIKLWNVATHKHSHI